MQTLLINSVHAWHYHTIDRNTRLLEWISLVVYLYLARNHGLSYPACVDSPHGLGHPPPYPICQQLLQVSYIKEVVPSSCYRHKFVREEASWCSLLQHYNSPAEPFTATAERPLLQVSGRTRLRRSRGDFTTVSWKCTIPPTAVPAII